MCVKTRSHMGFEDRQKQVYFLVSSPCIKWATSKSKKGINIHYKAFAAVAFTFLINSF